MSKQLEVSKSGYYKWLHRKETKEEVENKQLAIWIKEYDDKYNHILGYRRMTNWINRDKGTSFSKGRVQRIMNLLGINTLIRVKRKKYKGSTSKAIAENILHREFLATKPNEKWATDITEFKIPASNKKLYLSAIIDLYDRTIVSYILSNRNDNKLVFDTLDLAMESNPVAKPLVHRDRGLQYTHKLFQKKIQKNKMIQSMSRVGCCLDNGPTEGFWGIIKYEMYYNFRFKNELRRTIKNYIYFYNNNRYQERFGNLAPMEVRRKAMSSVNPRQYPIPKNKRILAYKAMLEEKKKKTA